MTEDTGFRFVWHEPERLKKTKALLVGHYLNPKDEHSCKEHLSELELLCETQGIFVADSIAVHLRKITASTFLTEGKLEELKEKVQAEGINFIVFDDEISPGQARNLEKFFGQLVTDRAEIILGVFAMRAKTREARLQVELAEAKYYLPRLKRMWTHLSRQSGGGGGKAGGGYQKGEGEKQIEIDKQLLKERIGKLSREIEAIRKERSTQRKARERSPTPVIALVGYTNAGKSSLMNQLTQADVYVEDKLFATLDTTTRKYTLENNQEVLFIDTVGFIRKLPHLLVAAFRSTLEEVVYADLILHVIDASHPNALEQKEASLAVIKELHADEVPVITVLNKSDLYQNGHGNESFQKLRLSSPGAKQISAKTGEGIEELLQEVIKTLQDRRKTVQLSIPQSEYNLIALAIREGKVFNQEYEGDNVLLEIEIPKERMHLFEKFQQFIC